MIMACESGQIALTPLLTKTMQRDATIRQPPQKNLSEMFTLRMYGLCSYYPQALLSVEQHDQPNQPSEQTLKL